MSEAVPDGVFNQDGDVVAYPAGVKQTVLLLNDVLNMFAWHGRVLFSEALHDVVQRRISSMTPIRRFSEQPSANTRLDFPARYG